jgi:hypothetical protein
MSRTGIGQLQKPQRVGDMAAALADHLAEIGLRVAVLVDQLLIARRLLDRIEVGALDVLDDRQFERDAIADLAMMTGTRSGRPLRRPPAPLAGDDFITARFARRPHHDRLDDAMLADRLGEIAQILLGEAAPRIARIGIDDIDRQLAIGADRRPGLLGPACPSRRSARPGRVQAAFGRDPGSSSLLLGTTFPSGGAQAAFAPDDLRGQLEIGLAAAAFQIVEDRRLAVGRRLRNPHVAGNHGLVDRIAHMGADILDDLVGKIVAPVEHGQDDALDGQARIDRRPICSTVCSSWLNPSSAKNSHCSGTSTESAAAMAFRVRRLSEGGQSIKT